LYQKQLASMGINFYTHKKHCIQFRHWCKKNLKKYFLLNCHAKEPIKIKENYFENSILKMT